MVWGLSEPTWVTKESGPRIIRLSFCLSSDPLARIPSQEDRDEETGCDEETGGEKTEGKVFEM